MPYVQGPQIGGSLQSPYIQGPQVSAPQMPYVQAPQLSTPQVPQAQLSVPAQAPAANPLLMGIVGVLCFLLGMLVMYLIKR